MRDTNVVGWLFIVVRDDNGVEEEVVDEEDKGGEIFLFSLGKLLLDNQEVLFVSISWRNDEGNQDGGAWFIFVSVVAIDEVLNGIFVNVANANAEDDEGNVDVRIEVEVYQSKYCRKRSITNSFVSSSISVDVKK